jgi:hypothetical protein
MKKQQNKKLTKIETADGDVMYLETNGEDDLGTILFETDYSMCGKDIPTHLSKRNLNHINEENIAFFFVAEGGAMGESGAVYVMLKNQKLFYVNYLKNGPLYDKLLEKLPSFEKLDFFVGHAFNVPEEYKWYHLGFGNYLLAKKEYAGKMDKLIGQLEKDYAYSGEFYAKWKYMALEILKKEKTNDSN